MLKLFAGRYWPGLAALIVKPVSDMELMKPTVTSILFGLVLFVANKSLAQTGCSSCNVFGYLGLEFVKGDNLVYQPVFAPGTNNLNSIFIPPDGTTLSFWDPGTGSFDQTSAYNQFGGWSSDLIWGPGQAVLVHSPTNFTWAFSGDLMAPDGSLLTQDEGDGRIPMPMPPPFSGPSGVYLLGLKEPMTPVFEWVVGRAPHAGEQFRWLVATNQAYYTTTYTGTNWDNGEPSLPLGEAAFFNLIGVPSLQIENVSNQVVISWPAWATNFILETSSIQGPRAAWSSVTNTSETVSNYVIQAARPASAFYRLHEN